MRYALFADIHSNLEAFEACWRDALACRVERFVFLGDLIGYGADPAAVVDRVMEAVGAGALVVQGNHDAAVVNDSDSMHDEALAAVAWTRSRLTPAQIEFLGGLPLLARHDDITLVHASAGAPEKWVYIIDPHQAALSIDAAKSTYVFSGHVHEQMLYFLGQARRARPFRPQPGVSIPVLGHRRWLAIVGSVGQPRDGDSRAGYAIFDSDRSTLMFRRVSYDFGKAAQKILAAGLPKRFAERLREAC